MPEVELPNPEELEEHKEKSFSRRVALVTAFYAVMLAITSLGGNNATKEMMLSQQQASDQWAFYQAKGIKQQIFETQLMAMGASCAERKAGMNPEAKENYDRLMKEMSAESARYKMEKKDIEKEAKRLEAERDRNMAKDPYFDYAEVLLQIAIVLSSISILAGSGPVFAASVVAAAIGAALSLNGYLMLFKLPFMH